MCFLENPIKSEMKLLLVRSVPIDLKMTPFVSHFRAEKGSPFFGELLLSLGDRSRSLFTRRVISLNDLIKR